LLVGCYRGIPPIGTVADSAVQQAIVVAPIRGTVFLPARTVAATMLEVATAATVSLIETADNTTVSTTVTDGDGAFVLTFPATFAPGQGTVYVLEAVKGLSSNLPGNNAARVRTLIRWTGGGWASITAGPIVVNSATTALAIGAALRDGHPSAFDFGSLIGAITSTQPDVYVPVANLSTADFQALLPLVRNAVTDNQDPVAAITLADGGTWGPSPWALGGFPAVTGISPSSGQVGTDVTVTGTGFATVIANETFFFNGMPATIATTSATSLIAKVPAGATTGAVTLQLGSAMAMGPTFTVTGVVPGLIDGSLDSLAGGSDDPN